ncbi:hypothetical protein DFP73DRAFT_520375 [Morchella snyderi]|nr:hypothetical protein DFP73DRAFT_520375 [Morchella snyderi]
MDPVPDPQVDVMNDPAYNTNPPNDGTQEGVGEPDHCRICRSEGTPEEPLFHPCKCSGSIKFVHQECLMEWLQHSQKKHCELCKTPFQFTKLYDPEMPSTIPTPLFLKRLFRHLVQNVILWARGALVGFVWLGWLPWCVRWMWRGWFWIGDGGWQGFYTRNAARESSSLAASLSTGTPYIGNGTSPAVGQGIIQFLSSPDLMAGKMSPVNGGAVNDSVLGNTTTSRIYPNGLFFDSNPFSNLTRYQAVNNVIIDTLEGQLLTALIVVSFILIFLIREWVVQQQPALAGGAAAAMLPQMEVREENQQLPAEEEDEEDDNDDDDDDDQDLPPFGTQEEAEEEEGRYHRHYHEAEDYDGEELARPRLRAIAPVRRRRFLPYDQSAPVDNGDTGFESTERPGQGHILGSGSRDASVDNVRETSSESSSNHPTRPHVNREVIARAAEVRREMEEKLSFLENAASRYDFGQPTSNDRSFKFRASPGNDHTPESGSSSGSRISERDGVKLPSTISKYNEDYPSTLGGRGMQAVDSHRNNFQKPHRRESIGGDADLNFGLQSNNHDSPEKQESYSDRPFASYLGPGATGGSSSHHAPDGPIDRWDIRQSTLEQGMQSNYDNEEQEGEEKPRDKGKGKEIDLSEDMEDTGFGSDDSSTGYLAASDEDEDIETEGNKFKEQSISEFLSGEISVSAAEVENSDSSTQPSTPTTSGSQAALADQQPEAALNFNIGDGQIPRRQLANAGNGHDPARMRQFEAGRVQQPAAQADLVVARGRGAGLWDWIVGDQQDRALAQDLDDMNSDNDEDENEDERDIDEMPLRDAPVIPQDVQQAIADEDAADDFDGIMELIGMRGPMAGLVQNAAISSVLITATVALGVAFPYVTGKICMIILAHPIMFLFIIPVTVVSFSAEFVVDSATCLLFSFLLMLDQVGRFVMRFIGYVIPAMSEMSKSTAITRHFRDWAMDGKNRVIHKLAILESNYSTIRKFPSSGVPPLSWVTRQSWSKVSVGLAWGAEKLGLSQSNETYSMPYLQDLEARAVNISSPAAFINSKFDKVINLIQRNATALLHPKVSVFNHGEPYPLYEWSVWDRVAAVLLGYAFFTMLGAIYLQNARKRNEGPRGVEKLAVELLQQAGGVMKVVLIIGIEMFVFPLYCGLLLDVALLPLFEDATILSRIQFFVDFPLTSIFVHWFVGTCYMFHFALFVSMCRKIMRAGVLYFIRDPDDPSFHPVKDVLDRPVMMQLRKIGFSALIYGVLVLVCLGGVVWSLWLATSAVLPIHWSSNEPVLEFPVDLLFYNFFMPIAVKFFKPSDGLQNMYDWWFKKCARMLRLTSFMFGERKPDEEGHQVRCTWSALFLRKCGDVDNPVKSEAMLKAVQESGVEAYFQRDGGFVRAPASDSVRRPKGSTVFIPVSEDNIRLDQKHDPVDGPTGPNSPELELVYIPPWFRTRIGLVVLGIWVFAAVTGIAVTIGPLLLGRFFLKHLVPNHVKLNDIYAFSVGVYILGGMVYAGTKWKLARKWIRRGVRSAKDSEHFRKATISWAIRAAKISYVLTAFAIVLPTLFALMIEFYVIIPIHTYFSSGEQHVIHFIQDWTLGVLYVKMMGRMLLLDAESPWARALRGVVARGYLDPDVKLATKCFIAPAGGFMLAALLLPLVLGFVAVNTILQNASSTTISQIYRYSYPVVFAIFLIVAGGYALKLLVDSWKQSIRDEVYLTGERLHNHGEAGTATPPTTGVSPIAGPAMAGDIDLPFAEVAGINAILAEELAARNLRGL